MIKTIRELVTKLKNNANVMAIIRYGGRKISDTSLGGDLDLFVFVEDKISTDVESIHLYIQDIPVDLNIRTKYDLMSDNPLTNIDYALFNGEILYDQYNQMEDLLDKAKIKWKYNEKISPSQIDWERFSQQHVIDKLHGRLDEDVIFSKFVLNANIYWLVMNYFRVRGLKYEGEKKALYYLKSREPAIYTLIVDFYTSNNNENKLKVIKKLTDAILEPVNGPWKRDEIIFLPRRKNYDISNEDKNRIKKAILGD